MRNTEHFQGKDLLIEEIQKYVKIKPNSLGKQNFTGANGTFTGIGHTCFAMDLEEYMEYTILVKFITTIEN